MRRRPFPFKGAAGTVREHDIVWHGARGPRHPFSSFSLGRMGWISGGRGGLCAPGRSASCLSLLLQQGSSRLVQAVVDLGARPSVVSGQRAAAVVVGERACLVLSLTPCRMAAEASALTPFVDPPCCLLCETLRSSLFCALRSRPIPTGGTAFSPPPFANRRRSAPTASGLIRHGGRLVQTGASLSCRSVAASSPLPCDAGKLNPRSSVCLLCSPLAATRLP